MTRRQTRKIKKTGRPNRCQCMKECTKPALKKQPFCREHMFGCSRQSPLSGCEPDYDPDRWNKRRSIQETHNCFSYSMNVNDPKQIKQCKELNDCDPPFHQPGSAAGYKPFSSKHPKTCPNMVVRILGDNPDISMTTFEERCPVDKSKIALIVDPKDDYHFLRQDSNKLWSHKPGGRPVKNIDARGHRIWDPSLADFNYFATNNGELNYNIFCGYMCVPRKKGLFLMPGGALARPFRRARTARRSSDRT